jgi:hypothetical protein
MGEMMGHAYKIRRRYHSEDLEVDGRTVLNTGCVDFFLVSYLSLSCVPPLWLFNHLVKIYYSILKYCM